MNIQKLPAFRCHKIVEGARILDVRLTKESVVLVLAIPNEGPREFPVDHSWYHKHLPEINGYVVRYEDGYTSYSPAAAFSGGYTPVDESESYSPIGRPLIISGFPGIGKSTLVKARPEIRDSDSSTFDKTQFPANYIEHIRDMRSIGRTILVSSHANVREALMKEGFDFTLVYPAPYLKDEYMARYRERGSAPALIDLMENKWEEFIQQCEEQESCNHYVLASGEYLADAYFNIRARADENL